MAKNKLKLNQSSSEPQPINNKSKSKSQNPETESKTDVEIGEHTAVALLSMGINLGSLSEKQLEALSHSNREESEVKRQNVKHATVVTNGEKEPVAEPSSIPSNSLNKVEALKYHEPIIEDLPMDLSKPVPNLINQDIKQNPSGAYLPHMPFNNSGKPASQLLEMSNFIISGMHYPLHLMERSGTPKSDEIRSDFMIPSGSFDPVVYTPQDVLENPLPIPKEMKYGWWRITDIKQFDSLVDNLHSRGSREKYLHRVAVKHRKFCIEAMELSSKPEFKFANGPMKAKESVVNHDATQSTDNKEIEKDCTTENDMLDTGPQESDPIVEDILEHPVETAFQIEMETLKQVEELFDRCIAVGMLNTAWSDMPKASVTQTDLEHIPYIP
uniref:Uncharacterized protein n=1 Tax=Ciona savignyi TaxID=51511 RepID=H2YDL7_CIOSA